MCAFCSMHEFFVDALDLDVFAVLDSRLRIQLHKEVHEGCREASEEWEKAEMALSQALKSKKNSKDRLRGSGWVNPYKHHVV